MALGIDTRMSESLELPAAGGASTNYNCSTSAVYLCSRLHLVLRQGHHGETIRFQGKQSFPNPYNHSLTDS